MSLIKLDCKVSSFCIASHLMGPKIVLSLLPQSSLQSTSKRGLGRRGIQYTSPKGSYSFTDVPKHYLNRSTETSEASACPWDKTTCPDCWYNIERLTAVSAALPASLPLGILHAPGRWLLVDLPTLAPTHDSKITSPMFMAR